MTTPTQMPESLKVPEELAAIQQALDAGPTKGRWRATFDGHGCMRIESLEWQIGFMSKAGGRQEANAALVAGCNPAAMTAVLAYVDALQSALKDRDAEIERLKKDAERWDFVRHHWSNVQMRWNNDETNSLKSITLTVKTAHWSCDADAIESQIDAAIDSMKGDANG